MKRRLRKILGAGFRLVIRLAASLFVRGSKLPDALQTCRRFSRLGRTSTVGYFNSDGEAPRLVADASLAALNLLKDGGADSYLSIKAPALTFDRALIAEIVDGAARASVGVHFDSHGPEVADATFAAIAYAVTCLPGSGPSSPTTAPPDARGWRLGCTLPGRWQRSLDDVGRAVDLGLRVRVVKGQWVDPSHPGMDPRQGYLDLVDRLAGRVHHVGVATHDPPLAHEALRRLKRAGASCELELLLGLPMQGALWVARDVGVPVRIYVPFGVSWLPYAIAQVQRNPYIAWWAVRDATVGRLFRAHPR